jgi:hypothetical protein
MMAAAEDNTMPSALNAAVLARKPAPPISPNSRNPPRSWPMSTAAIMAVTVASATSSDCARRRSMATAVATITTPTIER